jgi:serine/threonine-protein kinase
LLGLDQAHAEKAVRDAGLKPAVVTIDGLVEQKDKVIKAEPAEGSSVPKDSTVTISLSKGNQNKVPDVRGLDETTARQRLMAAGFTNIHTATNNDPPAGLAGKAILTTPQAGAVTKLIDPITIQMGAAAAPSPPPTKSPSPAASG